MDYSQHRQFIRQRGHQRGANRRPRQCWGVDMTKFLVSSIGWIYLVVVLDWYTKKIVGWNISLRSRAAEWKEALDTAMQKQRG
jgi:putative transposase